MARGRSNSQEAGIRTTQEFYNANATDYAQTNEQMHQNLINLANNFIQKVPANGTILDIGCGHGRDLIYFEEHGFKTIGVDISRELLNLARPRLKGQLIQADMTSLPLSDNSVDAIWSIASAMHLPKSQMPIMLAEARRVLKTDAFVLSIKGGQGEGVEEGGSMSGSRYFARYGVDELNTLLTEAGFKDYEIQEQVGAYDTWLSVISR